VGQGEGRELRANRINIEGRHLARDASRSRPR
jgi:hypothetical protein